MTQKHLTNIHVLFPVWFGVKLKYKEFFSYNFSCSCYTCFDELMWFYLSRGDHTSVDFYMAVVPPKTECVVFSIDGSFTASMSVTGRDPKVRAGAVDIVRWVIVSSGVFIAVCRGFYCCLFWWYVMSVFHIFWAAFLISHGFKHNYLLTDLVCTCTWGGIRKFLNWIDNEMYIYICYCTLLSTLE